jgi:ATP-dependent Clp protease ATP-binding subunit ClpA
MTPRSGQVEELLREAERLAAIRGHAVVGTEHLLLAMTRQSEDAFARRLLDEVGATDVVRSRIEAAIGDGDYHDLSMSVDGRTQTRRRVLRRMGLIAGVLLLLALLFVISGHWVLAVIFGVAGAAAVWVFFQVRTVR